MTSPKSKIAAVIALSLALAACTTQSGPQRLTGVYALSFEMQTFTADGRDETWWATLEPKAQAEMKAALPPDAGPRFGSRIRAKVEGTLSEPGHYGHLGAYPRHLTITRVLSAKPEPPP
jgi:hypothetical protein